MTQEASEHGKSSPIAEESSPPAPDKLKDYPIPPMPGQVARKPLLEKVDRKFGENFFAWLSRLAGPLHSKWLRLILPLFLLIIALLLASFFFLRPQEAGDTLTWRPLFIPQLQKSSYQILSGEEALLDRLNRAFQLESPEAGLVFDAYADQAYLGHAQPDQPGSALVFQADPQAPLSLEDGLLHLKILLAQKDKKAFTQAQDQICTAFPDQLGPEAGPESWPEQLSYLRLLFLACQVWPEDAFFDEIDRVSKDLLPLFDEDLALAQHENFEEVIPSLVSSNDQETASPDRRLEVVSLLKLDLWVLRALASRDTAWQPIADKWLSIAQEARLDSGFYAYAWDPETQSYVPSAAGGFQADSLASLIQIRSLWEVGAGRPDDLVIFNQLLMASGQFYAAYNPVNLSPSVETPSLPALLVYKEISLLAGQSLSLSLANQSLKLLTRGDSLPAGQGFLFRPDQADRYYFQDNYQNILLLAWEQSLKSTP